MNEPKEIPINGGTLRVFEPFLPPLTAQIRQQILSAIRSGGFAHIAAEAAGVPTETFVHWLEEGARADALDLYAGFLAEVRQAMAQARLAAEIAAFQKDPKVWLEHGPGKESPGNPGWTGVVQATTEDEREVDVFSHPEMVDLFRAMKDALADYPDLCRQLSQQIHKREPANRRKARMFWGKIM